MAQSSKQTAAAAFIAAREVPASRRRRRRALAPGAGVEVRHDGRPCINFCSNDYLGLARDPRVAEALCTAAARQGTGSGASQLTSGYSEAHAQLEQQLAEFTGYERALLFSNGYMANLGALTALADRKTGLYADRLVHASLIDAATLTRAPLKRFRHNDCEHLAAQLAATSALRRLIVTEGVFSMEGDAAPLPRLADLGCQQQALLYLDDAHGFGVLGETGRGSREAQGLSTAQVPLLMATLGKTLGVSGAFVAGSAALVDTIAQHARTLIYSTAPPPALAAAASKALLLVAEESWRRERLLALIEYWRREACRRGLPVRASASAIQPLMIGDDTRAVAISDALLERGLLVSAIRPPTVPEGSARIRITLTSAHDRHHVDRLLAALTDLLSDGDCHA